MFETCSLLQEMVSVNNAVELSLLKIFNWACLIAPNKIVSLRNTTFSQQKLAMVSIFIVNTSFYFDKRKKFVQILILCFHCKSSHSFETLPILFYEFNLLISILKFSKRPSLQRRNVGFKRDYVLRYYSWMERLRS